MVVSDGGVQYTDDQLQLGYTGSSASLYSSVEAATQPVYSPQVQSASVSSDTYDVSGIPVSEDSGDTYLDSSVSETVPTRTIDFSGKFKSVVGNLDNFSNAVNSFDNVQRPIVGTTDSLVLASPFVQKIAKSDILNNGTNSLYNENSSYDASKEYKDMGNTYSKVSNTSMSGNYINNQGQLYKPVMKNGKVVDVKPLPEEVNRAYRQTAVNKVKQAVSNNTYSTREQLERHLEQDGYVRPVIQSAINKVESSGIDNVSSRGQGVTSQVKSAVVSDKQDLFSSSEESSVVDLSSRKEELISELADVKHVNHDDIGNAIINYAKQFDQGTYVSGAVSPETSTFDCSGLVQYTFSQFGINLPRTTWEQIDYAINNGQVVSADEAQPGDLVFTDGNGHVGIYCGNNIFFNAQNEQVGIKSSEVWDPNAVYVRIITPEYVERVNNDSSLGVVNEACLDNNKRMMVNDIQGELNDVNSQLLAAGVIDEYEVFNDMPMVLNNVDSGNDFIPLPTTSLNDENLFG